jgi:hypothetical protein
MNAAIEEASVCETVAREFRAIEEAAPPGVLDVVQVYGDYATAVQQAAVYLGLLTPTTLPSSSNSTSQ